MALDWGQRRRLALVGSVAALAILAIGIGVSVAIYEPPTCEDGKQNGGEAGTDCGGSCARLCRADVVGTVDVLERAFVVQGDRIDVLVQVENRDRNAEAKAAPYTITLFDGGAVLGSYEGTIDLPAGAVPTLFIPGIARGPVAPSVDIVLDGIEWRRAAGPLPAPSIGEVSLEGGERPRATAALRNDGADALQEQELVAIVFDRAGQALGASATVVRPLPAGASAQATFTWPEPFSSAPARVEVRAVPVLP